MSSQITCCWCEKTFPTAQLQGPSKNRCPHCKDPVLTASFASLSIGQDFACKMGGSWVKISAEKAELHDAEEEDQPCAFKSDELVYPF
ncbi:hypothetical protein HZU77_011200 [Neisseriaceae bacterium TC5R-5]|nr:hypothetical protein [Neisseriaceae bacterium TC5R-5]